MWGYKWENYSNYSSKTHIRGLITLHGPPSKGAEGSGFREAEAFFLGFGVRLFKGLGFFFLNVPFSARKDSGFRV